MIAFVAGAMAVGAGLARADTNPVILQWFETRWSTVEYRSPDWFMAGYDGVWIPPPSKGSDPTSAGYDVFDRFDLGRPGAETAYGTEAGLRAAIAEFHRAGGLVYADWIMNHNSQRTSNPQFIADGGWPGFVLQQPGDFWGDFHDGTHQSQNPGGPNYDLWTGDLVGLIDIAQEKNYQFIRHPIAAGNPLNLPAGNIRNRPDPANARFYPDRALAPSVFTNPATGVQWTIYPFNPADPAAGDPVAENATGLLMRATQWMLDGVGVDGFRLDAAKHIPQWFWNNYWDVGAYHRRVTPAGTHVTPYSFVECVDSNAFTQTYIRKDAFGNRDALDLNGAGQLRDLRAAAGLGSWQNVLSAHVDNQDDGFNNGSQGVLHMYSHDNGTAHGAPPPVPAVSTYGLPEQCYLLFRPGVTVIYHNSRQFVDLYANRGYWPDEGLPIALGNPTEDLTKLVRLSNGYARGQFNPLNNTDPVNQSLADVLVFERRTPIGAGQYVASVLIGVNDRYDGGYQTRNIQTDFAPGTRLHELTGNNADPVVDPGNQVPELLIVDTSRRVLITVPNNTNTGGVQHHKGYVVYGPAVPSGTLSILTPTGTLPADAPSVPSYQRRLTPIDIVSTPTFSIRLVTTKTDPLDPNWDDNAVFRIDQGFRDFNGNGGVDIGESSAVVPGYEQFLTFNRPIQVDPSQPGVYIQTIDAGLLDEGMHYLSVVAFRHRTDGGDPIYTEFRKVIYVDRQPPAAVLLDASVPIAMRPHEFRVSAQDRTVNDVYLFLNLPPDTDPLPLIGPASRAIQYDRFEWRKTFGTLPGGMNSITLVALEPSGRSTVTRYDNINVIIGSGDVNRDGAVNIDDLCAAYALTGYQPEADMNQDGTFNAIDLRLLEARLRPMELRNMAGDQR